jgi:hypothetical protein
VGMPVGWREVGRLVGETVVGLKVEGGFGSTDGLAVGELYWQAFPLVLLGILNACS